MPFEAPAFHLAKSSCGDDVGVNWEFGTPPDRNGNGIVCERAIKEDLYDDHAHLIKK